MQEMQETWVRSLGREDPLEEGMATYSSALAWRIPWTGAWWGYSPWGHRELDTTEPLNQDPPMCVLRPSLSQADFTKEACG